MNLSEHTAQQAQVNALRFLIPEVDLSTQKSACPRYGINLRNNYVLLHPTACTTTTLKNTEANALVDYLENDAEVEEILVNWKPAVCKWAWLRLLTGQTAWTAWKEASHGNLNICISRNIKVQLSTSQYCHH